MSQFLHRQCIYFLHSILYIWQSNPLVVYRSMMVIGQSIKYTVYIVWIILSVIIAHWSSWYPSVLKYWEKEILKLVARWSSDVLSAANSQVTAHISLRACRVLLKAQLFFLNHYLFLYCACLVLLFSQNPTFIQTFNLGNFFTVSWFLGHAVLFMFLPTVLFLKRTGQYS